MGQNGFLFLIICFRHVQKARIQSRDALADALQVSRRLLKEQVEKGHDLDQEIKVQCPSLRW